MLPAHLFENADALAKLAALNPLAEGAVATSSSAHGRKEGGRTIKSSGGKVTGAERIGGAFTPEADPQWLQTRNAVLDKAVARTKAAMENLDKPPIVITLPDGKTVDGTAWVTSPLDVATSIS